MQAEACADGEESDTGMAKKRLGEVLRERGKISTEDLNRVLVGQSGKAGRLGELLLERSLVSKRDIASALEEVNRVPYEPCPPPEIEPEVLARLPRDVAARCCALPLRGEGRKLIVAMAEPQNLAFLDELRFLTGMDISPRFSFRSDVREGIRKYYGEPEKEPAGRDSTDRGQAVAAGAAEESDSPEMEFLTVSSTEKRREELRELQAGMRQRTPAVRLVTGFLAAAASKKASDIHIEPQETGATVRLRIDGVLRELTTVPLEQQAAVISRLKILADMDIAERRMPQDGRFLIRYRGSKLDFRVSTLPTHFGEKVVLRLLDPGATRVGFDQLGFTRNDADALLKVLALPQGMLLVTGPTGSGKTTTLYGALNHLCSPGRNIITVEDPIEYMLEGISQVQVNSQTGLTFAKCLRSILRQDPDVIMVGEVRDGETAEIALKAAQTGHFVLSTLHTNDSVAVISRLLDLGVPAHLIASSLTAIIAQRLVRKLCPCRRLGPPTAEQMERMITLGIAGTGGGIFHPAGCPDCENDGYKGRIGIFELLLLDDPIRDSTHTGARPEEIRRIARASGFRTMQESAVEKVREGLTSVEELLRVIPCETATLARCRACSRELLPAFDYCPFCGVLRREADTTSREIAHHYAEKTI